MLRSLPRAPRPSCSPRPAGHLASRARRGHEELAIPEAHGAALLDERIRAFLVDGHVAAVQEVAHTRGHQERFRGRDVADELAVRVRIGDEVPYRRRRRRAPRRCPRRGAARLRRRAPMVRHRSSGRRREVAVVQWSRHRPWAPRPRRSPPRRSPRRAIACRMAPSKPSVDEHADLAAGEALGPVGDDAQRRRRLEVGACVARPPGCGRGARRARDRRRSARRGRRRRCAGSATIRSRMSARSTLLSSNTKASAMCCCSIGSLAHVELPRLAVVVGEALRPQAALLARRLVRERPEAALRVFAGTARPRPATSSARSSRARPGCSAPCGRPAGSCRTGTSAR